METRARFQILTPNGSTLSEFIDEWGFEQVVDIFGRFFVERRTKYFGWVIVGLGPFRTEEDAEHAAGLLRAVSKH